MAAARNPYHLETGEEFEKVQMTSSHNLEDNEKTNVLVRLKRIEGQVRGIQQMVEEGRDCLDISDQIAAVRAAANALNIEILEAFALQCVCRPEAFASPEDAVEHAIRAITRGSR